MNLQVDVQNYINELLDVCLGTRSVYICCLADPTAKVPTNVTDLADLIAFNIAHASEELVPPFWTDQSE